VKLAGNAVQRFPLNKEFLDIGFHVMLLVAPYEQLLDYGDRLLAANGRIKIPFFSRDDLFNVVIDSRGRRLFTERRTA
jgi:hypothetical protein